MRAKLFALAATVAALACPALGLGISGYVGASAPYYLDVGNGELAGAVGYADATGRTLVSPPFTAPVALIITTWQSNIENAASGTFTAANTKTLNFNLYDGGVYRCVNPVLGTTQNGTGLGSNSANCQIPDSLITAGTYATAIVAPIAVGGTLCSDWVGGQLARRITVLGARLASRGLTAATGFTGDTWILPHGGETDAISTPVRATLATCIRNMDAAFTTAGIGTHRFFVPTESLVTGATNSTVTNAQADAVATGCSNCRAGANVDSLTGGNRQADNTHLAQTGAANLAVLDVTVITNCKNTSC